MTIAKTPAMNLETLRRLAAGDQPVEEHVLELLRNLQSGDEELRAWSGDALRSVKVLPAELAGEVAAMCLHPSAPVAAAACALLAKLGDQATEYQAPIAACLIRHNDPSARQQAALALASIPSLNSLTRDALRLATESTDPRLKRLANAALAKAG